ncbi:hypothetical protein PAL_GLEAN10005379 [Pteropus alecto]|uniref:Uncharacterized protein n=1 Tax=Pteropus alecto TaxID=9402 RepID=L5JTK5_PTEAL|nr:hypothetical protein PAL_GLEAN10005379 [Pteropus alecto]
MTSRKGASETARSALGWSPGTHPLAPNAARQVRGQEAKRGHRDLPLQLCTGVTAIRWPAGEKSSEFRRLKLAFAFPETLTLEKLQSSRVA